MSQLKTLTFYVKTGRKDLRLILMAALVIDRKRETAIIRVVRNDGQQEYCTSVSMDKALLDFALKVFNDDRARFLRWMDECVKRLEALPKKDSDAGASDARTDALAGFSRRVQREVVALLQERATIRPLPESAVPEKASGKKRRGSSSAAPPLPVKPSRAKSRTNHAAEPVIQLDPIQVEQDHDEIDPINLAAELAE